MSNTDSDCLDSLREQVTQAFEARRPLAVTGGGSKAFYGRNSEGTPLQVAGHRGILDYEPSELVLSARAGTPLADIEALLQEHGQMLAFEPPHFGPGATLGGTVACGLSGPRRPWTGAVRDFVLGVSILNGRGEPLSFGGRVMKNVAGYDLSRLMAGALGTLGVLTSVSVKVLPRPETEMTLGFDMDAARAIDACARRAASPLPLSGACHHAGRLHLRLSGSERGVQQARDRLGGERLDDGESFWTALRDHRHPFFDSSRPLWRLSVPPATPPLDLPGDSLLDWGGAQRWLYTDTPAERIRAAARAAGGHATRFRGGDRDDVFQPLPAPLLALHKRLKQALDPAGILNPGRLYGDL